VCASASQGGMKSRCLLGHLLITFACSSKPSGRGAASCAVKKWLGDILGKLDRLFLDQFFGMR